ncbi:MAG: hypothetical protein L0287_36990, partial [Anaerolineae bacterium]|nr:hypothetical protein [Anaerolineae bacterium]
GFHSNPKIHIPLSTNTNAALSLEEISCGGLKSRLGAGFVMRILVAAGSRSYKKAPHGFHMETLCKACLQSNKSGYKNPIKGGISK